MPNSALSTVQKFFPGVRRVVDADRGAKIEVMPADSTSRGIKNHEACALAVACKRQMNLDGVIISRSKAYLVKGRVARRFNLSPSASREVVSFDRGAGFAPGEYLLSPIGPKARLGVRQGSGKDQSTGNGPNKKFRHLTANVRTVLGGQQPIE